MISSEAMRRTGGRGADLRSLGTTRKVEIGYWQEWARRYNTLATTNSIETWI
jgi:hypothetical protein